MANILAGIFLVLHGLVHLLYFAQARRLFELQKGMTWPDGSWLFSAFTGNDVTRTIAAAACVMAAVGFVAGATGLFASQGWWQWTVIGAAVFSSAIFLLSWDGQFQGLSSSGIFALLINAAVIISLLVFRWPRLA